MEFIDNAAKLEVYTIRHCGRFPKRYTFTMAHPIIGYARDVYTLVSAANEYPHTSLDYKKRLNRFDDARIKLDEMVRQLRIAEELISINPNVMKEWMYLIDRELRLLGGIMSSDRDMLEFTKREEARENQNGSN